MSFDFRCRFAFYSFSHLQLTFYIHFEFFFLILLFLHQLVSLWCRQDLFKSYRHIPYIFIHSLCVNFFFFVYYSLMIPWRQSTSTYLCVLEVISGCVLKYMIALCLHYQLPRRSIVLYNSKRKRNQFCCIMHSFEGSVSDIQETNSKYKNGKKILKHKLLNRKL